MKTFFKEDKDSSNTIHKGYDDKDISPISVTTIKKNIKSKSFKKKQSRKNRTMKKI